MKDQCRLEDDGYRSSDFIVVEAGESPQALWIGVRTVFTGNGPSVASMIQVCLQDEFMGSSLQGPVFITPEVWNQVTRAVRWRLDYGKPRWKRLLARLRRLKQGSC